MNPQEPTTAEQERARVVAYLEACGFYGLASKIEDGEHWSQDIRAQEGKTE